jgi:hypothetical protein
MVGPLTSSEMGRHTWLLVAVDKFTKWIKAVPIKHADGPTAINFFKSITCRFGVPHNTITDNGSTSLLRSSSGGARRTAYASAMRRSPTP